jgi:DNA-directed RNA polymerase I and III subunit RPAC1
MHTDILLTKLAPGQSLDLFMIAHKGIGKDHAKFSPVCTASYRMLPSIKLSDDKPFYHQEAAALISRCPVGVFDIEELAGVLAAMSCLCSVLAGLLFKMCVCRWD